MLSLTKFLQRYRLFHPPREEIPFAHNSIKNIFPLIYSNNLLAKVRNNWKDYEGRQSFNEDDHPLPIVGSKLNEKTVVHQWSHFDQFINPQIIQRASELRPTPEYVGRRSGHHIGRIGWVKIGSSWKYARAYNDRRKMRSRGTWQERKMTPRFMLAPRVSPAGPRSRYEGKLQYSRLRLSKLLWAIDSGKLNPNEVIGIYHLRNANVIAESEIVWPGFVLVASTVEHIPYPINLELNSASPRAIQLIEQAGGTFTSVHMTHMGLYQELHPEEFPVFLDQELPDRHGLEHVATNPQKRGFLSGWYEEEGKYAHPDAGRRQSHYRRPPHIRDFPSTVEELDQVRHQQEWHLKQPGTGVVLPWHALNTADLVKKSSGTI